MAGVKPVEFVSPIVSVLAAREEWHAVARDAMTQHFGPVALESEPFAFDMTDYYEGEMGAGITRRFYVFAQSRDPSELPGWKLWCNDEEIRLAAVLRDATDGKGVRRPVNIDPGYINGSKLVLASVKDHSHKIYLRDGIYADMVLNFTRGAWQPHEKTFPDFRAPRYHTFLIQAREWHLKSGAKGIA